MHEYERIDLYNVTNGECFDTYMGVYGWVEDWRADIRLRWLTQPWIPVIDLYNGEIVAYETSHWPDFSLVMNMLKKAAKKCRGMAGPLLHSDQGWHYRMQPYRAAMARDGV